MESLRGKRSLLHLVFCSVLPLRHTLCACAFSSPAIKSSWATKKLLAAGQNYAASPVNESANLDDLRQGKDAQRPTVSPSSSDASNRISSAIISHHVAIKTRDIDNAIKFYSLLGFGVESKFVAGPARAAWLSNESCTGDDKGGPRSRIELLEVPSYMLNEAEGTRKKAIDLTKREELLGLNHFALDVTNNIPRPDNDDGASADGTACALYQLQEWMDDLNQLSVETFGKTLRVALPPTKRIIGKDVYEMAFLYDADGTLVELLNHSGTLKQEIGDGWEPWDGRGFVQ